METMLEILPAVVLFAEVLLFAAIEKRLWRTLYTPLNCLMLPYAAVLAICLAIDGKMGFQEFYYPSIWVWVVGLAVFFVPSFFLGMLYNAASRGMPVRAMEVPPGTVDVLEKITQIVLGLFGLRILYLIAASPFSIGSEGFGNALASHGFFGHLYTLLMILGIFWIFMADKEHKRYYLYVLGFLVVAVLYLVKGWLIIPILCGVLLRLLLCKSRLRIRLALGVVLMGFVFFFLTYWLSMFVAGKEWGMQRYGLSSSAYAKSTVDYILKHFVTYISAGVYGLSEDMAKGIVEERDAGRVFAPWMNLYNVVAGKEMVVPLNDSYLIVTTQDNGTNVRSFMGTLYVSLGGWGAACFVFVFSALVCVVFFVARQRGNPFALLWTAWFLGLMAMGWFDPYVQILNFITTPVFIALLAELCYMANGFDSPRNELRLYGRRI